MTDLDELIKRARGLAAHSYGGVSRTLRELTDALEAATEELENARAAAKLSHGFLEIEREEHAETKAERDAAEVRIDRWKLLVGKGVEERMTAEAERDAALEARDGWAARMGEFTAALAAVERVRAVVKSIRFLAALPPFDKGNTVMNAAADDIVAALDGAPEPEWEYEVRNEVRVQFEKSADRIAFDRMIAEVERAAAEKAYERGRLDERHDCNLTSLYHGNVISAEQLQRDLRSGNPYRAAALGLTAEQEVTA